MQRTVNFCEGEFYHVYNRGVDKRKIFFSAGDWKHFQRLLYLRNTIGSHIKPNRVKGVSLVEVQRGEPLVDICAYSLMPNHFHLLLKEKTPGGISRFMGRLLTSFSMYMNKKYERTGPLMCRPFRAKHVDSDEYFRWLVSYIHANPVELIEENWKQKLIKNPKESAKFLNEYIYSSYYDYFVQDREEGVIIQKDALPISVQELYSIEGMLKNIQRMS